MIDEARKNRIKDKIFNERCGRPGGSTTWNEAYLKYKDTQLHSELRAKIDAYQLDEFPARIDCDDLLAGHLPIVSPETDEEKAKREELEKRCEGRGTINGLASASTGHRVIDYEKLLSKGVDGVLDEIKEKLATVEFNDPDCAEKRSFYRACVTMLEAVKRFQKKYLDEANRLLGEENDPARKKELSRMAAALENVPSKPAGSFFEAIQSMWFMQYVLNSMGDITLTGRPDNYLFPYYIKDINEGKTSDDEVFELIEDFYFKNNMLYGSWPASLMVGGRRRDGSPNWNKLSYMFIRAIETTGLVNPSVAVCYNDAMPEDLLRLCLKTLEHGYTRPSIFNDDIIIKGLLEAGVTTEDANYYIHSTCVEITPIAAANILVATPYINLNKSLEYILNGGEKIFGNDFLLNHSVKYDLNTLDTFEKFYAAVRETTDNILKGMLSQIQDDVLYRKRYASSPLASCFLNDCLALGKDSAAGGARYSFIYPCFPGFMNLVDSLSAIKKAVYDDKTVTLRELNEVLKNNFEGEERLRAFLLNKCPKFGNDCEESDEFAKDLFIFIKRELDGFKACIPNGTFHPSYFAWVMHGVLGEVASATPDGRGQAQALSECLGSVQGMDKNGPLALMRSVAKIPQYYGIGGIATNFRFSKRFMHEGFDAVVAFVKEFMREGNFEAQFNVVDQKTLLDAQKHPEQYRTLLVRVAGFSDYFVNLSPIIQNEVISRLEHDNL